MQMSDKIDRNYLLQHGHVLILVWIVVTSFIHAFLQIFAIVAINHFFDYLLVACQESQHIINQLNVPFDSEEINPHTK